VSTAARFCFARSCFWSRRPAGPFIQAVPHVEGDPCPGRNGGQYWTWAADDAANPGRMRHRGKISPSGKGETQTFRVGMVRME
jgi:hypothetical protein